MFNTLVKQVELNLGGGIRITVLKQIFSEDGILTSEQPHRITIEPFDDFDQVIAENNTSLQSMGFPWIDPDELSVVTLVRSTTQGHPIVAERMVIERKILDDRMAEYNRIQQEEGERLSAEKIAADAEFDQRVADAVAKLPFRPA